MMGFTKEIKRCPPWIDNKEEYDMIEKHEMIKEKIYLDLKALAVEMAEGIVTDIVAYCFRTNRFKCNYCSRSDKDEGEIRHHQSCIYNKAKTFLEQEGE